MFQTKKSLFGMLSLLAAIPFCICLLVLAEENINNSLSSPTSELHSNPDSIPFAPALNYPSGITPYSVFSADLDADGDYDLAVPNYDDDRVSILKNNGAGIFQLDSNYVTGDGPLSVFCADMDDDFDLDLAVANVFSDNVSVLLNDGDGTFLAPVNYAVGDYPRSVFCADLDDDGDLDLAVANEMSNDVSILKNNGDGTFETKVDVGVGDWPIPVFCADLDGDGYPDIAVGNWKSNTVSILKNNRDGTFKAAEDYYAGLQPTDVFCADVDNDGDLDLTVANEHFDQINGKVSILKNDGDANFQAPVGYDVGKEPKYVFCADLDGDSDHDIAVANDGGNTISVLENQGDGMLESPIHYQVGSKPRSVFCTDLDRDGDLELLVANFSEDSVSILENLTDTTGNSPPYPFPLLLPVDGDTISYVVNFDWAPAYDPNLGDQIRYNLHISTSEAFHIESTYVCSNLTVTHHTQVFAIGTYHWKVKAKDNWGAENWSKQIWSFTTTGQFVSISNPTYILSVSNTGNLGHQDSTAGFYLKEDQVNLLYDGSPIMGFISPDDDTLVGRYIFSDYYLLPASDLCVDTLPDVKTIVAKSEFWPVRVQVPPEDQYWPWWKGQLQEHVMYSADSTHKFNWNERYMALLVLKLFHDDPPAWWPDVTPPATYPATYVGMALDINCPSDSGAWNYPGYDETNRMAYLQGYGDYPNENYTFALAQRDTCYEMDNEKFKCWPDPGALDQKDLPYAMHLLRNDAFVYPQSGLRDDSLYKYMNLAGYSITGDGIEEDYTLVSTGAVITGHSTTDTFEVRYAMLVADKFGTEQMDTLVASVQCGNCDRDKVVGLGDVVYLINYLFSGGGEPWLYMADCDGNCLVGMTDVVYLIGYLFKAGPAPRCSCPDLR